jgi:hypothetical protein
MENYETTQTDDLPLPEPTEDRFTETIEDYTASIPSSAYLGVALGAMGLSLALQLRGDGKWGNFIAQWVPSWLAIGVYNKLVKLEGHHRYDGAATESIGEFVCEFCDSTFSLQSDREKHQGRCPVANRVG